ncbi:choline ABC transporter ATP-binding protein, partial [Pseudomonas aeruginosa]|nr:choline ABC transporter ATP-binding protein [Pseudomonas aeruginosa]
TVSGRVQHRVGLAAARAREGATLTLTETSSALGPVFSKQLQDEQLMRQRQLDKTSVVVRHGSEEARKIGTRITIRKDDRII